jgi:hypothetical protein
VTALNEAAGGWKLANHALESRPPASTEQILHPAKYLADEEPRHPRLRVGSLLGDDWRRVRTSTVGEFDTSQLLEGGGVARGEAETAAAGWGGGRFELWRNGPLPLDGCEAPCRDRDVLLLAWRFDTEKDASEFATALRRYDPGGTFAKRTGDRSATVAFAPTPELAERLADAGVDATSD